MGSCWDYKKYIPQVTLGIPPYFRINYSSHEFWSLWGVPQTLVRVTLNYSEVIPKMLP